MAERDQSECVALNPGLRFSSPVSKTSLVPDGSPENTAKIARVVNMWGNPPHIFRAEMTHNSRPVSSDGCCDGVVSITYQKERPELKVNGALDSAQRLHRCGETYCWKCKEQVIVDLSLLRVELGLEFGIQRIGKVEDRFSAGNVQES